MKKTLLTLFAAFFVLSVQPKAAEATSASDILNYLVGKVSSFTSKDKWQSSLCKKASFLGLKYSLRSADGIACKEANIAAFALALCKGYSDFDDSHCAKNITDIYGENPNMANILTTAIKKDAEKVGKVACMAATFIPEIGALINIACDGLGL